MNLEKAKYCWQSRDPAFKAKCTVDSSKCPSQVVVASKIRASFITVDHKLIPLEKVEWLLDFESWLLGTVPDITPGLPTPTQVKGCSSYIA